MKKLIFILVVSIFITNSKAQDIHNTVAFRASNKNAWPLCQDFHPYKNIIAIGLDDKRVILYDIGKKVRLKTLYSKDVIGDLKFSPEGNYLLAVGLSGCFYLWSTKTWKPKIIHSNISQCLNTVCMDKSEKFAYCGSQDGVIFKINVQNQKLTKYIAIQEAISKIIQVNQSLYIGTESGNLYQLKQSEGIAQSIDKSNDRSAIVVLKTYDKYLYLARQNGVIKKLDELSSEVLPFQKIKTAALNGFDVLSELVASGNKEGILCIESRINNKKLYTADFNMLISSLCFSKNQHYLSISFANGQLIVLNLMQINSLQTYLPINFNNKTVNTMATNKKSNTSESFNP